MLSLRYKDERGENRKLTSTKVTCQVGHHHWTGELIDISSEGIFVETNTLPQKGGIIQLTFQLPYPKISKWIRFQLQGIIVRTQLGEKVSPLSPNGFAVRFTNLNPIQKKCLKKFVTQKHRKKR